MYSSAILLTLATAASAHIASWNAGMYCKVNISGVTL